MLNRNKGTEWDNRELMTRLPLEICGELKFVFVRQVQRGTTPTKFRGLKFPGNMHNYIWCPYYLPNVMKFCSVVSEELRRQAASLVNFGKFLSSKGKNSHKIQ